VNSCFVWWVTIEQGHVGSNLISGVEVEKLVQIKDAVEIGKIVQMEEMADLFIQYDTE
jgi:hypothetical protein